MTPPISLINFLIWEAEQEEKTLMQEYAYENEKPELFTKSGQVMFLKIRDNVKRLLALSGAVRMQEAVSGNTGSVWGMFACVDRLVELHEIREITNGSVPGQYRIFVSEYARH